ncbi:MAG: MATE family efflux transporter, partial [Vulcanimicrobiota bacterium]
MNNTKTEIIRKRIVTLALPSMAEYILKMTIGIVDTAFVGRLNPQALAVAGLSWSVVFFLT